MIPTVTSYFVIASGISSGNIYGIYVLTFYSGIKSDILFLHSIWHLFWHLIWHLSSIYSGIFSGILSDSFWYSIWHLFWHSFWHLFCGSIWHFIWHSILHSIQHLVNRFWHSLWHGHCRTSTASRSRCPAVPTVIWSLQEEEEEEEATLIKSRDLHLAGGEKDKELLHEPVEHLRQFHTLVNLIVWSSTRNKDISNRYWDLPKKERDV